MYKNKKVKKGYILLYVLLIGTICIIMLLYCVNLEASELKNLNSIKNFKIKAELYVENKEFLLTDLTSNIYTKFGASSDKEGIKNYYSSISNTFKLNYKGNLLVYNTSKDMFIVETIIDRYSYRQDFYGYTVNSGKVSFTYMNTIFIMGNLNN